MSLEDMRGMAIIQWQFEYFSQSIFIIWKHFSSVIMIHTSTRFNIIFVLYFW